MKKLSELNIDERDSIRSELNLPSAVQDINVVEDDYGWGLDYALTLSGEKVERGSNIRVLEIDPKILDGLPEDEVADLKSFIGEVFAVVHINFDTSVLVEKNWELDGSIISGLGLAVYLGQYELVKLEGGFE